MLNTVLCGLLMLLQPVGALFDASVPRVVRTQRQFARDELVLPTGPRKELQFDEAFAPFTGLILGEFDRGRYSHFYGTGPTQSGKTLLFLQAPALYHLFEMREDVGLGAPTLDMGRAIYEERIRPIIEASRFADQLEGIRGSGARGATPRLSVRFPNGARLRFLGAKGGDDARSSYTLRVLLLTEIDKMDTAGARSREADPVSQMIERTSSWGPLARVYGECTPSTEQGRIWREVNQFGTGTRPWFPCPHCRELVVFEREDFGGWRGAPDVMTARESAAFTCPICRHPWTERDRAAALRSPVAIAKTQRPGKDGTVEGELPRTRTWGFRWNALASPLTSMADIAEAEWRAEQTGAEGDLRRVVQFKWAEPFKEAAADLVGVTRELVLSKIAPPLSRGTVPPEAAKVTLAIDVGLRMLHYCVVAWSQDARGHVVDYGAREVRHPDPERPDKLAILAALQRFRDGADGEAGWRAGWGGRKPDLVLVDSGYEPEVIYEFARESGRQVLATKGLGTGDEQGAWRGGGTPSETKLVGSDYHIALLPNQVRLGHLHSDRWKREVHAGLVLAVGLPGSITIYAGTPAHHAGFAAQMTAEREEEREQPGGRVVRTWVRLSKRNHWFDAMYMARAGAEMLGIRLVRSTQKPPARPPLEVQGGRHGIRTKYS